MNVEDKNIRRSLAVAAAAVDALAAARARDKCEYGDNRAGRRLAEQEAARIVRKASRRLRRG